MNDGFEAIAPPKGTQGAIRSACVMGFFQRGKEKKIDCISLVFDPGLIESFDENAAKIIRGHERFDLAFNKTTRTLRLTPAKNGQSYKIRKTPSGGELLQLQLPCPAGALRPSNQRLPADIDSNAEQNALLIEAPQAFWA